MRYVGRRNLDGRVIWEGLVLPDSKEVGDGGWWDIAGAQELIFTFERMGEGNEVELWYANTAKVPATDGYKFRMQPFKEDQEYKPKVKGRWIRAKHTVASGNPVRVHIYGL